jgi:DNA-binding transcriptional LysR family regulator
MFLDIRSLALFARVAELRSISKAADASHIALAAASRRIALLEHAFGVRFLERTVRGSSLTPAGGVALKHARQILGQVDQMRAELGEYANGRSGRVRLMANASVISQYLPEDLARFAKIANGVRVSFQECTSDEIAEALRDFATDVGIVMDGVSHDGLMKFYYRSDRLAAIVRRDSPVRGRSVSFLSLLDHDLVGLEASTSITRLLSDKATDAQRHLRLGVQVKSFDALCKMVAAGLGVGILPEGVARPYATGVKLRVVPLSDTWAMRRMYVCVRDLETLPAITRKLVDFLVVIGEKSDDVKRR